MRNLLSSVWNSYYDSYSPVNCSTCVRRSLSPFQLIHFSKEVEGQFYLLLYILNLNSSCSNVSFWQFTKVLVDRFTLSFSIVLSDCLICILGDDIVLRIEGGYIDTIIIFHSLNVQNRSMWTELRRSFQHVLRTCSRSF